MARPLAAGPLSLVPPAMGRPQPGVQRLVVFLPGTSPAEAFDALARLDARATWVDPAGGVWAVVFERSPSAVALWRAGGVLAAGTGLALGCIGQTTLALP